MIIIKQIGDGILYQPETINERPTLSLLDNNELTTEVFSNCPFLNYIFLDDIKVNAVILLGSTACGVQTAESDYDLNIFIDEPTVNLDKLTNKYRLIYRGRVVHWYYHTGRSLINSFGMSIHKAAYLYEFGFLDTKYLLYLADDGKNKGQLLLNNKQILVDVGMYGLTNLLSGLCNLYKEANLDEQKISKIYFKKFYYHIVIINSILGKQSFDLEFIKRIKMMNYKSLNKADSQKLLMIINQYEQRVKNLNFNIKQLEEAWLRLEY